MLLYCFRVYSISEDLHGINKSGMEPSIKFTGGKLISVKFLISKIFHCEGLILCCNEWNTRLVVWNPCTGQKRTIKPRTRYQGQDTYALGYAVNNKSSSSCHSYKILRYCLNKNEQNNRVSTEFEIYGLCSSSWRVFDYTNGDFGVLRGGISLKGDTYWVAGLSLMKFDFTTERFVRFPLPFQSSDLDDTVLSAVRDEKLSVSHIVAGTDVMRIWVSNEEGKDLSWRSDFVLVGDLGKFDRVANVESFLLDEENKVAVCCNVDTDDEARTRIFVLGEDMYKQVYKGIKKPKYFHYR
ncbi:hypothetical protein F2Q69_00046956 [Brassica cretica]|uniref:F-box associated beta-propeller type 1 domain-containing protein n=1 Tax=Brassica cretica TaxID=69181 RepID=A0A8S9PT08_BRACR|nr:hypothetical protein F2Q69_00046956 [Brassica cretica]